MRGKLRTRQVLQSRRAVRAWALQQAVWCALEPLERRLLLSSVSGIAWQDRNGNGVQDAVELALAGRTIYWDANANGMLDAGDVSTTTAADGSWTISNVTAGPQSFRQVLP